ncbi:MAG: ATP synthase F1 subunit gamma [Alphaproteobacteria bacterium]|nr:ATP synthase F1 subunit gamma [Alphaproteobacteria bacterium]
MAGLKELRMRIDAIKSTQKITAAMKMVAASRLRRVQILVDKNQGYADNLRNSAARVLADIEAEEREKHIKYVRPTILQTVKNPKNYLLVVISSDRGLCGSYNTNAAKKAAERIRQLKNDGKNVKVLCWGKKSYDILRHIFTDVDFSVREALDKNVAYAKEAEKMSHLLLGAYKRHLFDVCEVVYADFITVVTRNFICEQICPLPLNTTENAQTLNMAGGAFYEYMPDKLSILERIVPILFIDNLFRLLVNAAASEHSARMTSMDNATRNAKDMISDLTLRYNSLRQSAITTELIEIIAGAEAV